MKITREVQDAIDRAEREGRVKHGHIAKILGSEIGPQTRQDAAPDALASSGTLQAAKVPQTHANARQMASGTGPTEAEFTRQVLELAKLHGWRTAHFRPGRTKSGWKTAVSGDGKGFPDLILLRREDMIVAELKVGRNKLTKEQTAWLMAFDNLCQVYVWHPSHWREIEDILR